MRIVHLFLILPTLGLLLGGCANRPPRVTIIKVPAGYLQPCDLPAVAETNPQSTDAFIQAYKCAELGNTDKERIIQWQKQSESRLR